MPSTTHERLIAAATRRFYRDGFRSVGIDQILADVGISKTAFYKHFDSKDDLMLAVLEGQDHWLQNVFLTMIQQRGGQSGADQLRRLFDVVETVIESTDFHGCIFVNAAMEFPLPHDPAHAAAARNKQAIEDIVRRIAAEAGAAEPHELARELCMIIEGVYVTRQVTGMPEAIAVARRMAERAIAAHLGPAAIGNSVA